MDHTKKPIIKKGVRILRPQEYESLISNIDKRRLKIGFQALLFSGLRYREALRLHKHPEWFDGDFINLPPGSSLKVKCKQAERSVRLNMLGKQIIDQFLDTDDPLSTRQTMNENLKRWATRASIGVKGISCKTTRKTWESWLVSTYRNDIVYIQLSQGHTGPTQTKHYLNVSFTDFELNEIKKYTMGWI